MSDSRATRVSMQEAPRWEHFPHDADLGVRGIGRTREQAFEQAALAMTAAITDPALIQRTRCIDIEVHSTDAEILLTEWLNAIVFEMATQHLLFSRFEVAIEDTRLTAKAEGEPVEVARHHPAVEVKGATFTELKVEHRPDGSWIAQCVVDV